MSSKIKINCKKVFDTGLEYENYAERLIDIKNKLENLSSSISSSWQGKDSDVFIAKLDFNISSLDELIEFLFDKGYLLKDKSSKHGATDKKFIDDIKRSDDDANFSRLS